MRLLNMEAGYILLYKVISWIQSYQQPTYIIWNYLQINNLFVLFLYIKMGFFLNGSLPSKRGMKIYYWKDITYR